MRAFFFLLCVLLVVEAAKKPWKRREIDDASVLTGGDAADGFDFGDFDGDDDDDLVVCYRGTGRVSARIYPGKSKAKKPWPEIRISDNSPDAEMPVWVDADQDGCMDVVVVRGGASRVVEIFWCNPDDTTSWEERSTFTNAPSFVWSSVAAGDVNRDDLTDIMIGSKLDVGATVAEIGWLEAPATGDKRDTSLWQYHTIAPSTRVVGMYARDMNGDDHLDLAVTDGEGLFRWFLPTAGMERGLWTEFPVGDRNAPAGDSIISNQFGGFGDVNGDGNTDAVAATSFGSGSHGVTIHFRSSSDDEFPTWSKSKFIRLPSSTAVAKAATPGDIKKGDWMEIAYSCDSGTLPNGWEDCVGYFKRDGDDDDTDSDGLVDGDDDDDDADSVGGGEEPLESGWDWVDVSGPEGEKFNDIVLRDINRNGKLDIVTTEEASNLGVVWYEYPKNNDSGLEWYWYLVIAVGAVVVIGGIVAFVLLRPEPGYESIEPDN